MPLYGCDCYAYALLASGFVDLVIESGLKVKLLFENDTIIISCQKVNASCTNLQVVLSVQIILIEVNAILRQPYDFLALVPVIEGAGGIITDWNGSPFLWEASPSAVATSMFNIQIRILCFISMYFFSCHKLIKTNDHYLSECRTIKHLYLLFHLSQALM